jgi:hypothetical protein
MQLVSVFCIWALHKNFPKQRKLTNLDKKEPKNNTKK